MNSKQIPVVQLYHELTAEVMQTRRPRTYMQPKRRHAGGLDRVDYLFGGAGQGGCRGAEALPRQPGLAAGREHHLLRHVLPLHRRTVRRRRQNLVTQLFAAAAASPPRSRRTVKDRERTAKRQ